MALIEVHNPATSELVGCVRPAQTADFSAAEAAAREAQRAWAAQSLASRNGIIRRFHDSMLDQCERILDVIQSETGKARRDAFAEIVSVAGTARYYLKHGAEHLTTRQRESAFPLITNAQLSYKPHGVVGLITPWNYPFLLVIGDAIPALMAGNAVLVKPSELTPLSADLGRQLLVDAGLDPRLFAILHGPGDVGAELLRHVDYVGFTGGTATGRTVAVAAAERLLPFSLELGGKNPMIILEGASLQDAASGLIAGAFANSGQTCIAIERAYVQESVFAAFCELLREKAAALKLGWSKQWDMDMGSLISSTHTRKVSSHVEQATALGAKILLGGRLRADLGPAFMQPTVLTDVPPAADLFAQETFGPVVSLYPVRDAEDAIQQANEGTFGLNASVWAGDGRRAEQVARRLETGSTVINSTLLIYNSFDVPMGGVKLSGIGRRHGEQGILRYTQAQSLVSSIQSFGGYDSLLGWLDRPSRAAFLVKLLKLWRKL
jgi:succinate-semialdehyde dehydrogenase/glutarate-semialdehyde dehydrogenase